MTETTPTHLLRAPRSGLVVGAVAVGTSSVFIDLSGTSPGTSTFIRCLLAFLILLVPAWRERRHRGPLSRRAAATAALAGALFAGDAMLWTASIFELGAGLSSVVVNAQVVILPLLTLALDREPLGRRYLVALPVLVIGIVLTAGVLGHGGSSQHPVLGTLHAIGAALCYSGFLYLLRRGGAGGSVVQPYAWVLVSAAVVALVAGSLWRGIDLTPGWRPFAWLVLTAVVGQTLGWMLVAVMSPRLPGTVGAALLLVTPIGALLLSALVTGERPTPVQVIGSVLVLVGAYVVSSRGRRRRRTARPQVS